MIAPAFSDSPSDLIPEPPDTPDPVPPSGSGTRQFTCATCGHEFNYSGRGRKPKYCDDCRPTKSSSKRTTQKSTSPDLQEIEENLVTQAIEVSAALAMFMPVTAMTLQKRSARACAALVKIASTNPAWLQRLSYVSKATPVLEIVTTICALFVASLVDMNRVNPYSLPAIYLGVSDVVKDLDVETPNESTTGHTEYVPPVHVGTPVPTFTPVAFSR